MLKCRHKHTKLSMKQYVLMDDTLKNKHECTDLIHTQDTLDEHGRRANISIHTFEN